MNCKIVVIGVGGRASGEKGPEGMDRFVRRYYRSLEQEFTTRGTELGTQRKVEG